MGARCVCGVDRVLGDNDRLSRRVRKRGHEMLYRLFWPLFFLCVFLLGFVVSLLTEL